MTDIELGKQALKYFHNRSTKYAAYGSRTFEELYAAYGKKADIYADGIGLAIRSTDMSQGDVMEAMEGLADVAQGRIPKDHQEYIKFLGNKASQINYLDLTKTVATEVATKALEGAQAVGDSVLTSLSWLTKLLPFIVIGAVLFIVYGQSSKIAGKDIDFKGIAERAKKKLKKETAK